jgi:predicted RNA-binding Zn ribbon-like protein
MEDEELLLAVLNSAPTREGLRREELAGPAGRDLARHHGGTGSAAELDHLRRMRDALQAAVRGEQGAVAAVGALLGRAVLAPAVSDDGIRWELRAPDDERLALRTAMAWSAVTTGLPGRLRPCANSECSLFLVDHSRPGTAKWCSMAACGNRMKARAHARRRQDA